MSFLCFMRRLLLLLLLFISAAPLRRSPLTYASSWPIDIHNARTFVPTTLNSKTGNSLPKLTIREMEQQNSPATNYHNQPATRRTTTTSTGHFPQCNRLEFPQYLNSRWRILHQRYDKYMKKMQVHRLWVDLQSPASLFPTTAATTTGVKRSPPQQQQPQQYREYYRNDHGYNELEISKRDSLIRQRFKPTISAGVMTNLGDFFNELKANVHFAEHSHQLGEAESKLLEGEHPHPLEQVLHKEDALNEQNDLKTVKLLQAMRYYRPSQKIRSLVNRNPNGYRGSQLIDPSYMWLGLGKK